MQKEKKGFVFFMLLFMVGLIVTSCSVQEVNIKSFEGLEVKSFDEGEGTIEFDLIISNPNWVKIKVNEMDLKIGVNGNHLGTAKLLEKTVVPANGDHPVNLKMHLVLEKSMGQIASQLGLAVLTGDLNLNLNGQAKGAMGIFPKTINVSHSEPISWDDLQKFAI